jgi:6-pyruvoyltetrahydropterin/6-carboxytetrahydropterin synthase
MEKDVKHIMVVCKEFTFDSAHKLTNDNGECANLHGHTYKLQIYVKGEVQEKTGYVQDFKELKSIVTEDVLKVLDHRYINDVINNPSVENVSIWIWERLKKSLPLLCEIKLWETPTNFSIYTGQ